MTLVYVNNRCYKYLRVLGCGTFGEVWLLRDVNSDDDGWSNNGWGNTGWSNTGWSNTGWSNTGWSNTECGNTGGHEYALKTIKFRPGEIPKLDYYPPDHPVVRKVRTVEMEILLLKWLNQNDKNSSIEESITAKLIDTSLRWEEYQILMCYIPGPNLKAYQVELQKQQLKQKEDIVKRLAIKIAKKIKRLHDLGVVHRDIKPENIVVFRGEIWLIDFGLSYIENERFFEQHNEVDWLDSFLEKSKTDFVGSPYTVSPQLIKRADKNRLDGWMDLLKKNDVWAFGVVIFFLVYGRFPFVGDNMQEIFTKIMAFQWEGRFIWTLLQTEPTVFNQVFYRIFQDEVNQPFIEEVISLLENIHTFCKKV